MSKSPILLMTYRKIECLDEIFHSICRYNPSKIYIYHNHPAFDDEAHKVQLVNEKVRAWQHATKIKYISPLSHSRVNESFACALDYVFAHENQVIILEDDTLPSPSFFSFCDKMLEMFKDDPSIGSIAGCNLAATHQGNSYFRTPFNFIYWGWATWASRWKQMRNAVVPWGNLGKDVIDKLVSRNDFLSKWLPTVDENIPWDVQWACKQTMNDYNVILPSVNLVTNKGFCHDATFTRFNQSNFSNLSRYEMDTTALMENTNPELPLNHEKMLTSLLQEILRSRGEL